jgi:hypothetical protein
MIHSGNRSGRPQAEPSVKNIVALLPFGRNSPYFFPCRTRFIAIQARSCSKHLVFHATIILYHADLDLSSRLTENICGLGIIGGQLKADRGLSTLQGRFSFDS